MPTGYPHTHSIKDGTYVSVVPDEPTDTPYKGRVQYYLQGLVDDPSPAYFIRVDDGSARRGFQHTMTVVELAPEVEAAMKTYRRSPDVSAALAAFHASRAAHREGSSK